MDSPSAVRFMLKNGAKRRLFRYFFPCVGVSLVGSAITTLVSELLATRLPDTETLLSSGDLTPYLPQLGFIYGMSFLFSLLISPLTMGSYGFFMEVSRDHRPPFTSVFTWLGEGKKALTAFAANLWYALIALKYVVLFILPPAALNVGISYLLQDAPDVLIIAALLVTGLLLIAGILFAYANLFLYTPAMFMLAECPALGIRQTFGFWKRQMRGHMWEFFLLRLSFIGWNILSAFTMGLSVLFVTPYINLTVSGYTNQQIDAIVEGYLRNPPAEEDADAALLRTFLQNRLTRDAEIPKPQNDGSTDGTGSDQE